LRRIAFFDFDGTITTKDTLLEFIKFHRGTTRFYTGFLINSPFLVAYKLGVISNHVAKEKVLRYFFRKMPLDRFQQQADIFATEIIPGLIRKKALTEIKKLQESGAEVVVVSASASNWIQKWSESVGVTLIATQLEIRNDTITGKISGRNCHGKEKVRRIQSSFDLSQYDEIYCYGDTKGDKPMLSLATFSFYQPFR